MRIAMISEHASPLAAIGDVDAGGQNVHVAELATALARRGNQVVVYTRRAGADLPEQVRMAPGVTVEHIPGGPARPVPKDDLPPYLPQMAAELTQRLSTLSPDVVHGHFWMSGRIGAEATEALDLPFVQTFHALGVVKRRHQGDADTSPAERIDTERELARTATRVTAACTDELRELVAMGAPRERVDVVPCGVDTRRFAPAGRQPVARRILSIGRLVPRKGVDDAIRALAALPDVELVVAGGPPSVTFDDDPEVRRLRTLADELGVTERVEFLGQVAHDDLPELIRSAEVVVCVPHYEPFGIVPLEAMACGVPVVGSAVGGLLDTVVDGVTGHLVPPRSPQLVARAIGRLLDDQQLQERMGAAARARSLTYAWPEIAVATERVYLRAALAASTAGARDREVVG